MSSKSVALCAALWMAASVALAAGGPMAPYYGNTLHETRANGTQSWFFFDRDHSFHTRDQAGHLREGRWSLNAQGETCITMAGQSRTARPACVKLQAQQVGDHWDRQGPNGNEHYVLERGRHDVR